AALGRACFLTVWQDQLTGAAGEQPLIMRWINGLIFWPLPIWVFGAIYILLFAAAIVLWWRVPAERRIAPVE
ncbi:MAG TPA: DUF2784 family protein, partial [Phenylobacterium sp.]|nr:DUF2784 family protein [Phenylobacterium sp.]